MKQLLLLHGAIGASGQLLPLADKLSAQYEVFTLDFSGHGGYPIGDRPYSIELFAADVLRFMDDNKIAAISIFGYSMGGYVGLYLAKQYPERVMGVVTLATKYLWTEEIAAKELQMLNAIKIEQKLPAFAQTLKERFHPEDWKIALQKTGEMMMGLGMNSTLKPEDYSAISTSVLLLLGDKDKMVTLDETISVYKGLPYAQLGVLPNTQHPIEQVNLSVLSKLIADFVS
jgi:pimeloyl-ACP methyl ester carboxylesterase